MVCLFLNCGSPWIEPLATWKVWGQSLVDQIMSKSQIHWQDTNYNYIILPVIVLTSFTSNKCFEACFYSVGSQQWNLCQSLVMMSRIAYFIHSRIAYFIHSPTQKPALGTLMQGKKWTENLETNKVEWTGKLEIRKDEFLVVDSACMAIGQFRQGC